ncbi:hypothetical protein [Herbaspirillum sp. alder98]|uniref:hypothetical protein n=1 Tax=Herbaspirillum sp. alder98 TaxID=2913096 RepID=UPI001CD8D0A7|nr:hypothetical protein [Herbaspirillum sp. alder98]MCA1326083.1 hypothetical protein [Herbaspirillum sp. alder98]
MIKTKTKTSIALLISTLALLAGCSTLDRMTELQHNYTDGSSGPGGLSRKAVMLGYGGPVKPWNELAIVTTDSTLVVEAIDGVPASSFRLWKNKSLAATGRFQLHLPPGEHVLTMSFSDNRSSRIRSWSQFNQDFAVNLVAGQVLHLEKRTDGNTWGVSRYDGSRAKAVIQIDFYNLERANQAEAY